ncbi:hypothetical protein HG531_004209 [Fusarium graminearum]|nr:hypothetical protein HG531_004209 [Fusarium graminearum]
MLSADAAVALLNPLIHPRFQGFLNGRIVSAHGNVKMQVGIAHVTIAEDVNDWVVGSSVVLAQGAQVIDDGAVRQNGLNTKNTAVQTAVAEQSQAASVCSYVSTDVARALSTKVERKDITLFGKRAANLVKGADLIHAGHANDDLVKNRDRASHEACVSTLGYDSQTLLVTVLEDAADFLGGAWSQHQLGLALVLVHPILVVRLKVCSVYARSACDTIDDGRGVVTQDLPEARDMLRRYLSEP